MMRSATMLALIVLSAGALHANGQQTETDFLLRVAEARAMSARNETDFAAVADAYRRAYLSGAHSGEVLGNMGTLLLNAGKLECAREALLQAERYEGTTWQIRRGLEAVAAAALADDPEAWALPWYRAPLAWHYRLPTHLRVTLALCGWALLWVALSLRLLGLRWLVRPLLGLALFSLIVFGTSAGSSLHAAAAYDTTLALQPEEVAP